MSSVSVFDWQTYRHMFSTPRMEEIFGERNTLVQMIEAEKAATRAQGKLGIVPAEAASGPLSAGRIGGALRKEKVTDVSCGSCLDDARIARIFWRVACGRVQVMSPAC